MVVDVVTCVKVHRHDCTCVVVFTQATYIGVCACCVEEGEAAAEDDESEEVEGWGVEEEEAEEAEAAVAADDEVSILLLCVMKRSRSFMAGRKVMMIFST